MELKLIWAKKLQKNIKTTKPKSVFVYSTRIHEPGLVKSKLNVVEYYNKQKYGVGIVNKLEQKIAYELDDDFENVSFFQRSSWLVNITAINQQHGIVQ